MEIKYLSPNEDVIEIALSERDVPLIIKYPSSILGFRGESCKRKDEFDLTVKMKTRIVLTKIYGKSRVYIKSNGIGKIKTITLSNSDKGIFLSKNVLFYSENIERESKLTSLDSMIFAKEILHTRYYGNGVIGYYGEGELVNISLERGEHIYLGIKNVIGFDANMRFDFKTYGNNLAAATMEFQYMFTGPGNIIVQTQNTQAYLENNKDSLSKRILRKVVPGGDVIIP